MGRRVVVTGMGTVNPLGNTVTEFWDNIKAGKSGAGPITHFDCSEHVTKIAAEVKGLDMSPYLDSKEARKMDPFSHFSVVSAIQAWRHAGLDTNLPDPDRVGVVMGVGVGGLETTENSVRSLASKGPGRVHPMTVPKLIPNIGPGNVAIALNAQGPCYCVSTACASGTDALGQSLRLIMDDVCDIMIAGGAEAAITPLGISGFNVIHALSTAHNDQPELASRPFTKDRDGFLMGEGAAVLILEELEHAKARGATILAELVGYGVSCDANHLTAPHPEGLGAIKAMKMALKTAGIAPEQIDYINAHGTSTQINDAVETKAIKAVFGSHAYKLAVSSTKSMTGHLVGAAGAVEAVVCVQALRDQFLPATTNLNNPDPELDLDYVPNKGRSGKIEYAMSNSLGFGGHNSMVVLKRY